MSSHIQIIKQRLGLPEKSINATIRLLEDGATIPFISRYRKEATGSMDELQVSSVQSEWKSLQELDKRKETVLGSIQEQGKLTPELEKRIKNCWVSSELEDIYLPFRPKRKTRASMAREKGLEPLAKIIMAQREYDLDGKARKFISKDVQDVDAALGGARDIIAEWVSEDGRSRRRVREGFERYATISAKVVQKKKEEAAKYKDYFDFEERLSRCPSHRLLAIRRAESEGFLRVSISIDEDRAIERLERIFVKGRGDCAEQVAIAVKDGYKRLLSPAIETEFRKASKEAADKEAIAVFSENLRQLLLAAPLGQKPILGLDPGFRTGCKVVCLDEHGSLLENGTIYPHPPQNKTDDAALKIGRWIEKHQIEAIAIGNGTAGRETERFVKNTIGKDADIQVFMVNEAGASIYSASEVAREEFPDLDLTVRGAISIARRLMDPLSELVKIDPKSIGVGQYQHDVNQTLLKDKLDEVVSLAVNRVGVNLNTASPYLLKYVSGITARTAKNIVEYRRQKDGFSSRKELMKVAGLGAKAFEQSAGFLRIPDAKHPLDNSAVHPERYGLVEKMAKDAGASVNDLLASKSDRERIDIRQYISGAIGLPTLQDIMKELEKPGLDPRGEAEVFSFADIHDINQLYEGLRVPGIVTNLTKFGAFVDIGIKENGLVHISQITDRFIKDPSEVLKLDQKVMVRVTGIDLQRKRIQLSMKD